LLAIGGVLAWGMAKCDSTGVNGVGWIELSGGYMCEVRSGVKEGKKGVRGSVEGRGRVGIVRGGKGQVWKCEGV